MQHHCTTAQLFLCSTARRSWASFRAHLAYIISILACCVWNGGSYYIEVFSKAYRKQFEGDAVTRRRLQLELLVNGNLPDTEPEPPQPTSPDEPTLPVFVDAVRPPAAGAAAVDDDGAAEKLKQE